MGSREAAAASLLPLYVAIAALFAALGLWVLLANPRSNLHRALSAALLLWAGSNLVFQFMRDAATPGASVAARAAATLYEVPSPFLFLFIVDELFLPKPRPPLRKATLAALAVCAGLLGVGLAGYPWADDLVTPPVAGSLGGALDSRGEVRFAVGFTFLPALQGGIIFLAEAAAAFLAARAAAAAPEGTIERRRAALVALAFGFLAGHNGGQALGTLAANGISAVDTLAEAVAAAGMLAGLPAVAYALRRVARAWSGRARVAAVVLVVLPVLAGLVDTGRGTLTLLTPFYINTRFIWVSAFAVGLALAILRYDLAPMNGARARRRAGATGAILAFGIAGLAAGLLVSLLGPSPTGLVVGLAALASPAVLALPPLRQASRRVAAAMALDPRDPAVERERARTYAAALRASPRPDEDAPALRALRAELGLSARDHALLASVLDEASESLAPGHLVAARYRVVRELGRGGFGEAFLARDGREGRDVVLKRLAGERRRDAEALRRFRKEAGLAGLLEHPHIVRVLGMEEIGGEPLLVMEYAPGGSLADRLRAGALPEPEVIRIGTEVLAALGALHAAGIVHRDVKPSNILFDAAGRAKLGDFTLARKVVSGETRGGAVGVQGTFPYLAPEQARGLPAGPAADIYALGVTLYEAVSGGPPFETDGLSEHDAALVVTQHTPRMPVPRAPPALSAALARTLAKAPEDRFRGAEEMASALRSETKAPSAKGGKPRPKASVP